MSLRVVWSMRAEDQLDQHVDHVLDRANTNVARDSWLACSTASTPPQTFLTPLLGGTQWKIQRLGDSLWTTSSSSTESILMLDRFKSSQCDTDASGPRPPMK